MPEERRIDEFVFILMAGLVLISVIIVFQYSQNQTENAANQTTVQGNLKIFNFGDFKIEYQIGTETLLSKDNLDVKKGIFSEKFYGFVFEITSDKLAKIQTVNLIIEITSTNKLGRLVILINDKEVYNDFADVGRLNLEIDKGLLRENNKIFIKVERATWKFWQDAFYLVSFKLNINYFGQSSKDFIFTFDENDLKKFDKVFVQFRVNEDESTRYGNLIVYLNKGEIYKSVPPLLVNLTIDFPGKFKMGKNVLEFRTEPNSVYKIEDLTLILVKKK